MVRINWNESFKSQQAQMEALRLDGEDGAEDLDTGDIVEGSAAPSETDTRGDWYELLSKQDDEVERAGFNPEALLAANTILYDSTGKIVEEFNSRSSTPKASCSPQKPKMSSALFDPVDPNIPRQSALFSRVGQDMKIPRLPFTPVEPLLSSLLPGIEAFAYSHPHTDDSDRDDKTQAPPSGSNGENTHSESDSSDLEIITIQRPLPQLNLAQCLKHPLPIVFPIAFGKTSWNQTHLMDNGIATSALKAALTSNTLSAHLLWASFLQSNTFTFGRGSGCNGGAHNMIFWLSSNPSRKAHVRSLEFTDFFGHDRVRWNSNTGKRMVYRPIALMSQCPNLTDVRLEFRITDLPGFVDRGWNSYVDHGVMEAEFHDRFRMRDIFEKTAWRTIRRFVLVVNISKAVYSDDMNAGKLEAEWLMEVYMYFKRVLYECGRPAEEVHQVVKMVWEVGPVGNYGGVDVDAEAEW